MTMMLIPLLILLLIPLGLVLKFGKMPRKMTHWLLLSYIGVLILATVSLPFITTGGQELEKVDSESDGEWWKLTNQLRDGKLDSPLAEKYAIKQSQLDLEQKETLQLISEQDNNFDIVIEQKEQNDDQLEVFLYQGKFGLNGFDFSFKLEPMQFELEDHLSGKALRMIAPNQDIQLAFTLPEFPIRQFTEAGTWAGDRWRGKGGQIIYLRVPHNLEVIADEENSPHLIYVRQ